MSVVQQSIVLLSLTISFTISFIVLVNHAFGIEYKNYTSEEHGIQFQYPTNWTLNKPSQHTTMV